MGSKTPETQTNTDTETTAASPHSPPSTRDRWDNHWSASPVISAGVVRNHLQGMQTRVPAPAQPQNAMGGVQHSVSSGYPLGPSEQLGFSQPRGWIPAWGLAANNGFSRQRSSPWAQPPKSPNKPPICSTLLQVMPPRALRGNRQTTGRAQGSPGMMIKAADTALPALLSPFIPLCWIHNETFPFPCPPMTR